MSALGVHHEHLVQWGPSNVWAHLLLQPLWVVALDVLAVDEHSARAGHIVALQQLDDGALAPSCKWLQAGGAGGGRGMLDCT